MIIKLRSSGLESADSESGTVILDEQAEQFLSANAAGSILWKKLEVGTTREDLVTTILHTFDGVERARAEEDVDAYLARLDELGLLEPNAD